MPTTNSCHLFPRISVTLLTFLLTSLLLTSCTEVGPNYKRSELKSDLQFEDATPAQLAPDKVIRKDWWTNFNDPNLDDLISNALEGSYDLKILVNRILAAGALLDQSEADLYPSLDLGTGASLTKSNETGTSKSFASNLSLNWELDIWGKNKRKVKMAQAEQQAVKADYRAGYLTLVSDVAIAYFTVRQYDAMSRIADAYIKSNKLILSIYEQQHEEGLVSEEKIYRQRALVNESRQDQLEINRGRTIQEHKIAALLGKPMGEIKISKNSPSAATQVMDVPVGLPSDLLNNRPDILAAEYRLTKATQEIGIAEAARLPSISLTARGGFASGALSALLGGGFLAFVPNINIPIFDGGQKKAEVEKVKHEVEIEKNKWAKTANTAFQEVADSLTNLSNRKQQMKVLNQRINDLKKIHSQLNARLELGLISQLEMIDVQQNLYDAEKSKEKLNTQLYSDTVLLYKALGGGWPSQ